MKTPEFPTIRGKYKYFILLVIVIYSRVYKIEKEKKVKDDQQP
jgi:hypothetical protein